MVVVSQPRFEVSYPFHDSSEFVLQTIGGPGSSLDHRHHPAPRSRYTRRCLRWPVVQSELHMTAILGLSAFYHDSAAALVVDGRIVAAAQEERFSRIKHDPAFPAQAMAILLGRRQG